MEPEELFELSLGINESYHDICITCNRFYYYLRLYIQSGSKQTKTNLLYVYKYYYELSKLYLKYHFKNIAYNPYYTIDLDAIGYITKLIHTDTEDEYYLGNNKYYKDNCIDIYNLLETNKLREILKFYAVSEEVKEFV